MEFVQKYWWIILTGVVLALLVASKGRSSGGTVQQIGGGDSVQLAAIASAERQADEQNRVGLFSTILGYIQGKDNMAFQGQVINAQNATSIRLAQINATAQTDAASLAATQYNAGLAAQSAQAQLAYQLQLRSLNQQHSQNTQSAWLQAILGGLQTFSPLLLGSSGGGGNSGGGGWGGLFGGNSGGGWIYN